MTWDIYPLEKDGRTTWTAWHVEAYGRAPDRTRPLRIDVRHAVNAPGDDGLPQEPELTTLIALRDALEHDVTKAVDAKYVVRTTGGGEVVHTFYAPTQQGFLRKRKCAEVAAKAAAALAEEFPAHPLTVTSTQDEEWSAYFTAFPSDDGAQWFADARQLSAIVQAGAPQDAPTAIVHRLVFPSEEALDRVAKAAEADGFALRGRGPLEEPDEDGNTHGLELEREVEAFVLPRVHGAVLDLVQLAHEADGQYLGWALASDPAAAEMAERGGERVDDDDDDDDDGGDGDEG
ncbi:MAG: DUF695 domain-containing protein [Myxococcales bacterium]|nr:DUF695 domain-containing protein [Myxococcales bacterium]